MPKALLTENASLRDHSGARWKATLITPGQGSSGNYSESLLERDGAKAFPAGTKLFFNHPEPGKSAGRRDPRDQWGYLPEDAHYEPGVGLVGEPEVLPHAKDIVESLGKQASLSVFVMGESDDEDNVTELLPHVTNSIDIVAYPGRPGSGLTQKMYEAFLEAASEEPGVTSAQEKKKEAMDKEILEAIQGLTAAFTEFRTESKAQKEAAEKAEADADATDKAVSEALAGYKEKVTAINAAEDLLPSQRASLLEAAERGEDVAPLIESAKEFVSEAKKQFSEGVVMGNGSAFVESATGGKSLVVTGWSAE